ncbi:MAG: hypothetical protein KF732_12390 [Flavobacteriales bacterium]|nr:hypothetical protein [Flavobacteriales bacterium]
MIPSKSKFIKELAMLPELKGNVMSVVFGENPDLIISSKSDFFDNVKHYYEKCKSAKTEISLSATEEKNEIIEWLDKDLRIKSVRLKSVKGFPNSEIPYGIDFCDKDGTPTSMVILGGNATGKSSIYDALEYIYCNEIGEAQLRSFRENDPDRFNLFLEHFENGTDKTFCKVESVDKSFDIQNTPNIPDAVRSRINPDTHFISDYDVYENGQLNYQNGTDKSFHNKIAESIGLKGLLEFNKHLKAFIPYGRRKETSGINSAAKTIETQEKLIETTTKSISEKKGQIDGLEKNQKTNPEENDIKKTFELLSKVRQTNVSFSFEYIRIENSINEFKTAYNNFISKQIKSIGLNELQFLNLGLELLDKNEDCPFCENSKLNSSELKDQTNKRIEKIKELNSATQALNSTFKDLIEVLPYFVNQINNLKGTINRELSEIEENVEFNALSQTEVSFAERLSEILAKDLFVEINQLDSNANYLSNKNQYLFQLLENNKITISTLPESLKEINDFITKRSDILFSIDETIRAKTQSQGKSITEQIIELKKEISDFESQINQAKQIIQSEKKKKEEFEKERDLFNEIKESTKVYEKVVSQKVNEIVNTSFAPIKLVVEEVLEKYFEFDNRNLELIISKEPSEIDEETGEILSEIITAQIKPKNNSVKPQAVGKVLNTFHYRLFSTMVGIAIAIASRKNTGINMPLVLDDIFYASDFENRATVETFIEALFKMFKDFTPELDLQLILFTHDQLIFESTVNVLTEIDILNENKIAFGKLFPHPEAKELNGYKNLIYQYPSHFSKQSLNRIFETK